MKHIRVIVLLTLAVFIYDKGYTQPLTLDIAKNISVGGGEITDTYIDNDGNYYISGLFGAGANFDPDNVGSISSIDNVDGYIAKYGSDGSLKWYVTYVAAAGDGGAIVSAIHVDQLGNVYAAGSYYGSLLLDPLNGTSITSTDVDAFFVKLSSEGALLAFNTILSTSGEDVFINDIDLDSEGNLYAVGMQNGVIVKKLDTSFQFTASQTIGTGAEAVGIHVTEDGYLFLTGSYIGNVVFDANQFISASAIGGYDGFVARYDLNDLSLLGQVVNVGGAYYDQIEASAYRFGFLYINGIYNFDLYIDQTLMRQQPSGQEMFLVKMNNNGGVYFANGFATNASVSGTELQINEEEQIYLAGTFSGVADFNATSLSSYGGTFDTFVNKYDFNGNQLWVHSFGGSNSDGEPRIALSSVGFVFTGFFNYNLFDVDFDPTNGTLYLPGPTPLISFVEKPVINSFSSTNAEGGSYIYIYGYNLYGGNHTPLVNVGGMKANYIYGNDSFMYVQIPPGTAHERISITVNGLTSYSDDYFNTVFTPASSGASASFTSNAWLQANASSVNSADFDGDGKPDVLVTYDGSDGTSMIVLKNTTTGQAASFTKDFTFTTTDHALKTAYADFNSDGKIDIVTANSDGINASFSVYENKSISGNISFGDAILLPHSGATASILEVTDFNFDGKVDVVGTDKADPYKLLVFINETPYGEAPVFTGKTISLSYPASEDIEFLDLNNDGRDEMFISEGTANVMIYTNYSAIDMLNVSFYTSVSTSSSATELAVSDVDGDGLQDLAVADPVSKFIYVYQNGGFGTLSSAFTVDGGDSGILDIAFADLNGDAMTELIATNNNLSQLIAFPNSSVVGTINFGTAQATATGAFPAKFVVGDFNLDGKADMISANQGEVQLFTNTVLSPLPVITSVEVNNSYQGSDFIIYGSNFSTIAQQNIVYIGATRAEVYSANSSQIYGYLPHGTTYGPMSLTVNGYTINSSAYVNKQFDFFGSLPGSFEIEVSIPAVNSSKKSALGDFNADGKADILFVDQSSAGFNMLKNNTSPSQINETSFELNTHGLGNLVVSDVAIGDLNSDGLLDAAFSSDNSKLVVANTTSAEPISFTSPVSVASGTCSKIILADIDGDGRLDLVGGEDNLNTTISINRNNTLQGGTLTFDGTQIFSIGSYGNTTALASGDLDMDGLTDVIIAGTNTVLLFMNNSSPGAIQLNYSTQLNGSGITDLKLGDLDNDGRLEVVFVDINGLHIWKNSSDPETFNFPYEIIYELSSLTGVTIAEINGDGFPDILLNIQAGIEDPGIQILVNQRIGLSDKSAFSDEARLTFSADLAHTSVGDLDNDGRNDLVVADNINKRISIFRNLNSSALPPDAPTDLAFTEITKNTVFGTFTPAASNPDGYLVVRTDLGEVSTAVPQDGTVYVPGQAVANSIVVYSGNQPYFNASGLENASSFRFTVFSYNGTYSATRYNTSTTLSAVVETGSASSYYDDVIYDLRSIGSTDYDQLRGAAFDQQGNLFVTGSHMADIRVSKDLVLPKLGVGEDAFVVGYNPDSTVSWYQQIITSSGAVWPTGIATDDSGNVYVAGIFAGDINFSNGILLSSNTGSYDVFIAKFNQFGAVWARSFGSPSHDTGFSKNGLRVTPSGVYMTGEFAGAMSVEGFPLTPVAGRDVYIVGYDANGINILRAQFGGDGEDYARDLEVDSNGNVYLCGTTSSSMITANGVTLGSNGDWDAFMAKFNSGGVLQWAQNFGGPQYDEANALTMDSDQNLYVTGYFYDRADFDFSEKMNHLYTEASHFAHGFLAKYNANANLLWAKTIATGYHSFAYDLQYDGIGNIYLAGTHPYQSNNLDPNGGSYLIGAATQSDVFVAKYATDGFLRWATNIDGSSFESVADLAVGPHQEVVLVGNYNASMGIGTENGDDLIQTRGDQDAFLLLFGNQPSDVSTVTPTITSITTTALLGEEISITGSNFSSTPEENIVRFNGVSGVVTTANAGQLTVQVPSGATYGTVTVTVNNRTATSSTMFNPTYNREGELTFAEPIAVIANDYSDKIVTADFNVDGKADILRLEANNVNAIGSPEIVVLLNTSTPGSVSTVEYFRVTLPGGRYSTPAIGDLDNDGKLDIALANYDESKLFILRNSGNGFATPITRLTPPGPVSVAFGDLDLDGRTDIALVSSNGNNTLSLFRNRSVPGSLTATSFDERDDTTLNGAGPIQIQISEMKGDAYPDLVISYDGSVMIEIFENQLGIDENNPFLVSQYTTLGEIPYNVKLADINKDGYSDIVTSQTGTDHLNIIANGATGLASHFSVARTLLQNHSNQSVGDIDGNGFPDIITSKPEIILNNGHSFDANAFAVTETFTLSDYQESPTIVDFDGDGRLDILSLDYNTSQGVLSVLLNTSQLVAPLNQTSNIIASTTSTEASFTVTPGGDGQLQLVVVAQNGVTAVPEDTVFYLGNTVFSQGSQIGTGNYVISSETKSTTYSVSNLAPGQQYAIRIFDFNKTEINAMYNVNAVEGNPVTFYTLATEPMAPSELALDVAGTQITVLFDSASNLNATGYLLFRTTGATAPDLSSIKDGQLVNQADLPAEVTLVATVGMHDTLFVDTGLEAPVTYTYAIVPFTEAQNEVLTRKHNLQYILATGSTIVLALEPAGTPTLTLTVNGTDAIQLEITKAVDANKTLVVRKAGNEPTFTPLDGEDYSQPHELPTGEFIVVAGEDLTFTDIGLVSGTRYYYKAFAYNNNQPGDNNYGVNIDLKNAQTVAETLTAPTSNATDIAVTVTSPQNVSYAFTGVSGLKHLVVVKPFEAGIVHPAQTTYTGSADISAGGASARIDDNNFIASVNSDGILNEIHGLTPATQYALRVYAYNDVPEAVDFASGSAAYNIDFDELRNNPVYFYTWAEAPTTKPSLSASVILKQITLTFPPLEGVSNGYVILRKSASSPDTSPITNGVMVHQGMFTDGTELIAIVTDPNATSIVDNVPSIATYTYMIIPYNRELVDETVSYNLDNPNTANATSIELAMPEPGSPINFAVTTPTTSSLVLSFNAQSDSVIIVRRPNNVPNFVAQDGVEYTVGMPLANNQHIVYKGVDNSYMDTGLAPGIKYYYTAFSFNTIQKGDYNYSGGVTVSGTTESSSETFLAPTKTAYGVDILSRDSTTVTYQFEPGNGIRRMVVLAEGTDLTIPDSESPSFTGNSTIKNSEDMIGDDFVVSVSAATEGTIMGMKPGTHYTMRVFEYNDIGDETETVATTAAAYNVADSAGNPVSFYTYDTEPAQAPSFSLSVNQLDITLNFPSLESVSADRYMILRKESNEAFSLTGIFDGVAPELLDLEPVVTLVAVISDQGALQYIDTDLQPSTLYNYAILPFNIGDGDLTINYRTSDIVNETISTEAIAIEPSQNPTINFADVTEESVKLTLSGAVGADGYVVLRRQGTVYPINTPEDKVAYDEGVLIGPANQADTVVYAGTQDNFIDSGLKPNTEYSYRAYAYGGGGQTGLFINYQVDTPGEVKIRTASGDETGPVFSNDESPTTVEAGSQTINFSVQVTDESPINAITAHYKVIASANDFVSSVMTLSNGKYTASVTTDVGELGVQYYFTASDNLGNSTTSNKKQIKVNLGGTTGLEIPYTAHGNTQANYRIVSIPLDLVNKSVSSVFSKLGEKDATQWRIFHYDNGSTNELSLSSQTAPGLGYWLIVKDNPGQIFSGEGTSVASTSDAPFRIQIKAGFNQIGNPYPFPVKWSDVRDANAAIKDQLPETITRYAGQFQQGDGLNAFEGGFINYGGSSSVDLIIPPIKAPGNFREGDHRLTNPIDAANWEVNLSVSSGMVRNQIAGFGMREEGVDGFDPYDAFVMPRFLDYVDVKHRKTHGISTYSKDIIPTATNYTWNFAVESNISTDQFVSISWDNAYFGINEKQLILWDIDQQLGIDMKTSTQYKFDKNASGRFKVIYGSPEYVKENISVNRLVFHVLPNPVKSEAKFCFTLPQSERVTVEVMDVTGKVTEKVFEGMLDEGYHELSFSGADKAKGVYIARIKAGVTNAQKRIILE